MPQENIITFDGGGEGPPPPSGPEYTHIGNSNGGSSGIDSSTTNYDPSTGVVEFNVSGSGVLTVDSDTLYVDNGNSSDGYYDQTMGVYLDMGLGLSSALIPSSNTVTNLSHCFHHYCYQYVYTQVHLEVLDLLHLHH